jgi:hypothetical protein
MRRGPDTGFTYRARKDRTGGRNAPKDHRYSLDLIDEATGSVAARCVVRGAPLHKPQTIELEGGAAWNLRPNRLIMPSHWIVRAPDGRDVLLLDQRIFGKLVSPLTRVSMNLRNPQGAVLYRVVEPDASLPERLLGPGPGAWTVESDAGPVALIARIPKTERLAKGWRGKLQRFLQGTDTGLISLGEAHRFGAAESLAILLIFRELLDQATSVA